MSAERSSERLRDRSRNRDSAMSEGDGAQGGPPGGDNLSICELICVMEMQSEAIQRQNNQLKVLELE